MATSPRNEAGSSNLSTAAAGESLLFRAPFFARVPAHFIAELARALSKRELPADHELFKQGSVGDTFYLILKGSVRVYKSTGVEEDGP